MLAAQGERDSDGTDRDLAVLLSRPRLGALDSENPIDFYNRGIIILWPARLTRFLLLRILNIQSI